MKKICHVTSVHNRYDIRIFEKECTSLADNGYDVCLLVNDDIDNEEKNGVKIVSTGFKPIGRRERMLSSMKYIWDKALQIDADVYHLHDPELLQLVKKLKKKNKVVIFDAHEDAEEQIMDKYWIPYFLRKLVSKLYAFYAKSAFKKCDGIITVTPTIVEKMRNYNQNVEMITNYPIISSEEIEKEETNIPYVFFAGGISEQWCHERIIEAIENVDVAYKLAGPIENSYLEVLKQKRGWSKTEYLGKIPHSEVRKLYANAIAGMAINDCAQIKGEGTLGNTKLFEVMEAQVPVICTDYRLWKEIVEKNECGICVDSKDVNQIAEAIRKVLQCPEDAIKMGLNGRNAVKNQFNWKCEEKKLVALYEKIC